MDDADQKLEISPESIQYYVRRQAAGILITKTIYTKFFTRPKPRISEDIPYLPFEGDISNLPNNTPEHAVATFLDHWCNKRFGPIADALLYFTDTPKGKKAGMARQDFGKHVPVSFKVLGIEDQTAAVTHVLAELRFEVDDQTKFKEVSVRAIYQDLENNPFVRSMPGGHWRIVQNSFTDIIYAPSL